MSGKLDQSLDDILSTRRKAVPRRARGKGRAAASNRSAGPAGGIQKSTRSRSAAVPNSIRNIDKGTPALGDSKIIVSNLPSDVNEAQIKEYFGKSVAPVKRAMLTYGPNGVSRGIATIIFARPGSANEALIKMNGMLVDKRPMKVEVVLDAKTATQPPVKKALSERMTQPKSAAKPSGPKGGASKGSAAKTDVAARGGKAGRSRARRAPNARPKAKTADELDAEMADYFNPNDANATSGAKENVPVANGGGASTVAGIAGEDLGMDEIS